MEGSVKDEVLLRRMAKVLPAPLTHGGSGDIPVYLRSAVMESQEGWGCPAPGEGEAGGPGGPEAGTSAILAGERTTLHRVPSLPPARGPGSRSPPLEAGPAQGPGARWGVGVTSEARETWPREEGGGGTARGRGKGEGTIAVSRKATFRRPSFARACSLNTRTARRGAVAMVTRVPATELNGCCLATPGVEVLGPPT